MASWAVSGRRTVIVAGRSTRPLELTGEGSRTMDNSENIARLLTEIRDLLREGRQSQIEALEFLRANAERTKSVVDRSVALQDLSVQRQKKVLIIVIPLIVVCLGAIGYLLLKL